MKHHVHVYRVVEKAGVDISCPQSKCLGPTDEGARMAALDLAKKGKLIFGESDCEYIALLFPGPEYAKVEFPKVQITDVSFVSCDATPKPGKPCDKCGNYHIVTTVCSKCGSTDIDVDEEKEDGTIMMRCNKCGAIWESR